ncbi:MAG: helix-turn-helix domain-containing protein, partial [Pseudomonadota bacterium]
MFRQNGFAKTSIDDVMEAASLTRGGFYAHFKSKEDLFANCVMQDINYTDALRQVYADKRLGESK